MLNSKCRLILLILLSAFVVSCNEVARHKVLTFLSPWYIHEPRNNCTVCHGTRKQRRFSAPTRLIAGVPKLCYDCHTDYTISAPFVHGPVAVGKCLICHNPHKSKTEHLLKEPEPEICYQCHIVKEIEIIPAHLTKLSYLCTDCHEAHASSIKYLLKVLPSSDLRRTR